MKLATLACLSALCLLGPSARAAPGDPPRAEASRPDLARPDPVRPDPPRSDRTAQPVKSEPARPDARAEAGRVGQPVSGGARERRRRSYAACNRASHQRGYYGGRRRRFLIRCRLGYERTRSQQGQQPPGQVSPGAPTAAPAQPSRKP